MQVVKEVLSEQWPEVTDNWREALGNLLGSKILQGQQNIGYHIQEHRIKTILPKYQYQKYQLWYRCSKTGPNEEKVVTGGLLIWKKPGVGRRREKQSTAKRRISRWEKGE